MGVIMNQDALHVRLVSGIGQFHSPHAKRNPQEYIDVTLREIAEMSSHPPKVAKEDGQWAIFSTRKTRVYNSQRNLGKFSALWADIDDPAGMTAQDIFAKAAQIIPANLICYTSRSAKPEKQKCRIIVPLAEEVDGHSYAILAKVLNDKLESNGIIPDRRTEEPGQICYLPNRGEFYHSENRMDGDLLHPSAWDADILAERGRIAAAEQSLVEARERARLKAVERMRTGAKSPIEAFNAAYGLEDVSLPMYGYQKRGDRWLSPNSETGNPGVKLSDDGLKWISSHGSDAGIGTSTKNGGTMGDAFDLFTHYEHMGDRNAAIKAAGAMFTTTEGCTITEANQRAYREQQAHDHAQGQFEDISGGGQESKSENNNKPFSLQDWQVRTAFVGEPPKRQWLVSDRIPMGQVTLIAAAGDTGKTGEMNTTGVAVTSQRDGIFHPLAFGGEVLQEGAAVLILGEDDAISVHGSLLARRGANNENLIVVPMPNAGGAQAYFKLDASRQPISTQAWHHLCDELKAIQSLKFFGLDPLQVFCHLDLNLPENAQFVCSQLSALASETGAAIVITHHFRKTKVTGPESAREAIRGTTGLVDGVRCAYALWLPPDDATKGNPRAICRHLGIAYAPNKVVQGAVVKSNNAACRYVSTFIRNEQGMLIDYTNQVTHMTGGDMMGTLVDQIRQAAINGRPYTKTGVNGLYERRHEFPEALQSVGKHKFSAFADELLERNRIVMAMGPGSNSVKWLDIPDGPFARGEGEFQKGSNPKEVDHADDF
jgi:hypothetical protein